MKITTLWISALLLIAAPALSAQDRSGTLSRTAETMERRLQESAAELTELRQRIDAERLPLSERLSALEAEFLGVRDEYQKVKGSLDQATVDIATLTRQVDQRRQEITYVSGLLDDYIREFDSRIQDAERQRLGKALSAAMLAPENTNLDESALFAVQAGMVGTSIDRLNEMFGGTRFEGTALDADGLMESGKYALVGPLAVFRSDDGVNVGTAEIMLGSFEPSQIAFLNPADAAAAAEVVKDGRGFFPVDPTLGNAHKIEATEETLLEHVQKGGVVMYPIFIMAGLALLVALYKWLSLVAIRKPSRKKVEALLRAVGRHDISDANQRAAKIKGPVGEMLSKGMEHIREPRELIEEVMYETVLATRLKLQRMLPFVAICAASAPLLGLLGTVTGIIGTFKMITVHGSGDVQKLSGGISEALITTEFGLIVAIPSLLLHAFLSRKAKGVVDHMEKSAIAFVNQVSLNPFEMTEHDSHINEVAPETHNEVTSDLVTA